MKSIENVLRRRAFARQVAALEAHVAGAAEPAEALLAAVTASLAEVRRWSAARQDAQRTLAADPGQAAALATQVLALNVRRRTVRRALGRGWVDAALLDERLAGRVASADLEASLALELAAQNATRLGPLAEQVAQVLEAARGGLAAPLVARAAARTLVALAPRWPAEQRAGLVAVCRPLETRERTLAATLLEARWLLDPDGRGACLRAVLERQGEDDFLLRQQAVVVMTRHGPPDAALLTLALRDPSEHVRLALASAALALPPLPRRELLGALAGDVSLRVRASCAAALGRVRPEADEVALMVRLRADAAAPVARVAEQELAAWAATGVALAGVLGAPPPARDWLTLDARAGLLAFADADLRALDAQVGPALARLKEGQSCTLRVGAGPEQLGPVLALHARDDFGLYASAAAGGYRVRRGARFAWRAWRLLHELTRPSPYKRQDHRHSLGRVFDGELRAHSSLLAESTPTIPGEPVDAGAAVGWGSFLPTVDDLLSVGVLWPRPVVLYTSAGATTVTAPASLPRRVWARWHLGRHYARLAELRRSALAPADALGAVRYVEQVRALGFTVQQQERAGVGELPAAIRQPFGAALVALPLGDRLGDLLSYALSPSDNSLPELGLAVTALGLGLLVGNLVRREQLRRARREVPLVIGGWGTRGKSGTERLKAAMLGAQGVSLVAKTTGCEAMFIHQAPGLSPCEVFIHRSYDKATIWEQRDLLRLAAALGSDAFLWECMALSPPLVRVLQRDWMRDDFSTLTNAYPDHEDIQGPAGHDVARVIAQFIRPGGTVLTSEDQMLPMLRAEAQAVGAQLTPVGPREELLLGEDLLARFPYQEHPWNIALVRRLAVELGLDPDLATADMAEQIVPDLGVLKTYPTAAHRGRALTFVNGMSANERTGFLSNWRRTGFDAPRTESAEWLVTVVNNRQDRVARSKVFADILVRDAAVDRHLLIGTNLAGLRGYVRESLARWLDESPLVRPEDPEAEGPAWALQRVAAMARQLRVGVCTADALGTELAALGVAVEGAALVAAVEETRSRVERLADAGDGEGLRLAATLDAALPAPCWAAVPEEARRYAARSLARRALLHALAHRCRAAPSPAQRAGTVALQRQVHQELLDEMIVSVDDSSASGDQVIDHLALACPPGAKARVMGIQNIKGTGLDFVYRFVRLDEVAALVRRLERAGPDEAVQVCGQLAERVDHGMLDAALAADALTRLAAKGGPVAPTAQRLAERLGSLAQRKREAAASRQGAAQAGWRRLVGRVFDPLDAVWRRRRADQVLLALAQGLISHPRAAAEMRALGAREKGGWLRAPAAA